MDVLTHEQLSYLIGLLHSDGNLYESTRNRGKISIELNISDIDILIKIKNLLGGNISERKRTTNFGYNHSAIITIYNLEVRNYLKENGLIAGKKSEIVYMPDHLSKIHYLRGYIDGDGSIGMTGNSEPFVSIVTKSEALKEQIVKFLFDNFGLVKNLNRNKRDSIYNITIKNENAIKLCNMIYSNSTIYMNRKYNSFKSISSWKRTKKIGNRH